MGFNRTNPSLFYSRRIGRTPQGAAAGEYVESADLDDDHRRREGDGQDEPRLDGQLHRRRHCAGVGPHVDRRRAGRDRGGAVLELPRRPRAPGRGPARRIRHDHDGREPKPVRSGPRRATRRQRLRPRRRRARLPHGQARLRRHGQLLGQPRRRLAGIDRAASAVFGALLPAARRHAHRVRPGSRFTVRVEPAERLQQEQRQHQAQCLVLGREPRLRGERRRLHDERRPDGRARVGVVSQTRAGPVQPEPAAARREVEHVELRRRPDGRRLLRELLRPAQELLVNQRCGARRPVGLQRSTDARRADDARAGVHGGVGASIDGDERKPVVWELDGSYETRPDGSWSG